MNAEGNAALHSFKVDCCYVTLHRKKLVIQARAMTNLSVDQGHSSQLVTISSIAAKDVYTWESPQRKLGEISV